MSLERTRTTYRAAVGAKLNRTVLQPDHLEDRDTPSAFYDLHTAASTSDGFVGFGDLPSINSSGTVAFVGYTDTNSDGRRESGLWTYAPGALRPTNVNPTFSSTESRDFGREVSINDSGTLVARDQYSTQFFVLLEAQSAG